MVFTDVYALITDLLWLVFEKAFSKSSRKAGTKLCEA